MAVFGPYKQYVMSAEANWFDRFDRRIRKEEFIEILLMERQKAMASENILSGFRRTGIAPFDPTFLPRIPSSSQNSAQDTNAPLKNSMEWIFQVLQPGNFSHDIQPKSGICVALNPEAFEKITSILPRSSSDSSESSIDSDTDAGSDTSEKQSCQGRSPTKGRVRRSESNLSSLLDRMSAGFRTVDLAVGNVQISVNDIRSSFDTFRGTIEVHETRITQHDHDIAELRSRHDHDIAELRSEHDHDIAELRSEHDHDFSELRSQLGIWHDRSIAELRSSAHAELQYLCKGLHRKISECDQYRSELSALQAQVEELQKAGRRTRVQQARKQSGRLDSGEVLEDALGRSLRCLQQKQQEERLGLLVCLTIIYCL